VLLMTRQASNSRASVRPSYIFPYQHIEPPGTSHLQLSHGVIQEQVQIVAL
jgi:hypothetical protein